MPTTDIDTSKFAVLTEEQRRAFHTQGYFVVEDALPQDFLEELVEAADQVHARMKDAGEPSSNGDWSLRNCIVQHDAFFRLLDYPTTVPLAWQLLNWNIQMNTSHLVIIPPKTEPSEEEKVELGFHRDGGTSSREMEEPHPRIMLKIAYILSDQRDPSSGATWIVPGSNRMAGRPPVDPQTGNLVGAKMVNLKPGDAFLFEQRTYHSGGRNWSQVPRKTVFFGYGYRWFKAMDYIQMPDEIVAKANPIQKQLLGVVSKPLSFFIPVEKDVPLKKLLEDQ
ncbi:MAG: phytanoyl-CoA dioxygenase family protein [Planctomycetota bacterium]|jgi:ectoine hydroxylase-related dioxygenase (phytanoyl-CoA dioxygenase family)|nr:phytanoyl-CoA dioxygenase family protein [Planctomycetota bacterium]